MWKNRLGLAIIVIAIGFGIRSLKPAHAEIGPSVASGSNPIQHYSVSCGGNPVSLFANTSSMDFIVTDFIPQGGTYTLYLEGSPILVSGFGSVPSNLASGIKVQSGETLSCQNNYGYRLFISGRFVQP